MTTQNFKFITDTDLQAASGGGLFSTVAKGLSTTARWAAKLPDTVVDAATTAHDALSSKGQLQNLQLGIA